MKPLEEELRSALRRREPPAGFTERVMARVEQQADARVKARPAWRGSWLPWDWFGRKAVLSFAAAAAVVALAFSLVVWRQHQIEEQRRQGEAARAQVMQALRVTSAKLNRVRSRVRSATQERIPDQEQHEL